VWTKLQWRARAALDGLAVELVCFLDLRERQLRFHAVAPADHMDKAAVLEELPVRGDLACIGGQLWLALDERDAAFRIDKFVMFEDR
jgi:hypothetical protein